MLPLHVQDLIADWDYEKHCPFLMVEGRREAGTAVCYDDPPKDNSRVHAEIKISGVQYTVAVAGLFAALQVSIGTSMAHNEIHTSKHYARVRRYTPYCCKLEFAT